MILLLTNQNSKTMTSDDSFILDWFVNNKTINTS
jgi:hypothetical protein